MAGTRYDVRYSDQTEMGSQVLTWAFARKVQKAHAPAGAKDVDGDGWVWINLTDSTPAGGTAESFEEGEVFTARFGLWDPVRETLLDASATKNDTTLDGARFDFRISGFVNDSVGFLGREEAVTDAEQESGFRNTSLGYRVRIGDYVVTSSFNNYHRELVVREDDASHDYLATWGSGGRGNSGGLALSGQPNITILTARDERSPYADKTLDGFIDVNANKTRQIQKITIEAIGTVTLDDDSRSVVESTSAFNYLDLPPEPADDDEDDGEDIPETRPVPGTTGDDIIDGTPSGEKLRGRKGDDFLSGKGGDDRIFGGGGADSLNGGPGADVARGGGGADWLFGLGGDDRLTGGRGKDYAAGGGGSDRLVGGKGHDELWGGNGRDKLKGGAGTDDLAGGGGRDDLAGGKGRDELTGGSGRDKLVGGRGADKFVFFGKDGRDVVKDFERGSDQVVIVDGADRFRNLDLDDAKGGAIVAFAQTRIVLKGIDADDLSPSDFLFA